MTISALELDLPSISLLDLERDDALAEIEAARRQHWLARTDLGFSVLEHRDAVAVLRDRRFHSALALLSRDPATQDGYLDNRRRSILSMEGDEHARLRRLVAPAFTPAAADRLRPFMAQVIGQLVDAVAPAGRCELVVDVCEPYPIPVICELLGAPKSDWKLFSDWATEIFKIFNNELERDLPDIQRASEELDAYVRSMVEARRASPRDDLLSDLIAIEEAGDRLSTDELVMLAEAVLMAGTDTTRNQLGCAVALFTGYPDQWRMLAERPELAPQAVEECMRYLGSVRGTVRFASVDIEYRDVLFPRGTLVSVSLAGANRSPEAFEAPDRFDICAERQAVQLTFGSGVHHCMGAALARAELQEALPLLARRMPGLSLDGAIVWKPPTVGIWGPSRLPIRFEPSPGG